VTTRQQQPPAIGHEPWPAVPLEEWRETYATLHRWTQIVGKTRLALAPMQNHWWQVVLYLTSRGLGTSPMPTADRALEIEFDFIDHQLVARTSDGESRTLALASRSVADFYDEYMAMLRSLGVEARIRPVPVELADVLPFADDRVHATYDGDAAQRCWRALLAADRVLKEFRGRFIGKSSPSHFFWGSFDLACTRFSGRRAPPHPGGVPNCPDWVTREAYSHECISSGWWPGSPGSPVAEAAFYAYAYPEPAGCPTARIRPEGASYNVAMREWILPYESVRTAKDPHAALMEFLQSTYEAAATLGGWNRAELERA
jgi:uncharacterized protein DUF5996